MLDAFLAIETTQAFTNINTSNYKDTNTHSTPNTPDTRTISICGTSISVPRRYIGYFVILFVCAVMSVSYICLYDDYAPIPNAGNGIE